MFTNGITTRLLIAGNLGGTNVGDSFYNAASEMGIPVRIVDTRLASAGPRIWRAIHWRFLGHRLPAMPSFNRMLQTAIAEFQPTVILATGLAPIKASVLQAAARAGVITINYLTDDPWNPAIRARWFFDALPHYSVVFSPRKANMPNLTSHGCAKVEYLPFAYDPRFAYVLPPHVSHKNPQIVFVGGGDSDRARVLGHLIAAGFQVDIYGSYWERYPSTSLATKGQAPASIICQATANAKIALCLVRRANRDGHVMRTFEIAAMGACMLAEDTAEHREILGPDGHAVTFFSSLEGMVAKAHTLLNDEQLRRRLGEKLLSRITCSSNTYRDRLARMLGRTK